MRKVGLIFLIYIFIHTSVRYAPHRLADPGIICLYFLLRVGRRCFVLFCFAILYPTSSSLFFVLIHSVTSGHLVPSPACRRVFSSFLLPSYLFISCLYVSRALTNPLLFTWHPSLLPLLLFCTHSHLTYTQIGPIFHRYIFFPSISPLSGYYLGFLLCAWNISHRSRQ